MQKVLVTGATGTIGQAIVKEYASKGFFVYIHYFSNEQKAQQLLEEIDLNGALISFDMQDKESIKNSLEDLEIDVLINNAGIIKDNLFFFMADDEWESVMNTNLNGLYYVTKTVSRSMIKHKKGSIVNMTSISGLIGNQGQANYSASKGAIISLTKTLCIELGRYNIRVNAIAPGLIESEMIEDIPNIKELKKVIPLKRLGQAKEVAQCSYFLGVDASYISGEVLTVSGGMVR